MLDEVLQRVKVVSGQQFDNCGNTVQPLALVAMDSWGGRGRRG
jgi:hypothetical protein